MIAKHLTDHKILSRQFKKWCYISVLCDMSAYLHFVGHGLPQAAGYWCLDQT